MRLAEAHCVSVATFYRQVIYPAARADAEKQGPAERPCPVSMEGITKVGHCLNGLYSNAANPVRALERLTCVQGLHLLTWLPWEPVLSRHSLLRQQRAWCPVCFDSWQGEGQTIYEPLLWTLQVVKLCPIHHCPLVELCPSCQRGIELLSNKARTGHCSRCRQWLGYAGEGRLPSQYQTENDQLNEQLRIAKSVGELIAKAPELTGPLSRTLIRQNLKGLINHLGGNANAFAEFIGCDHNSVSLWCEGRCVPRLELVLKLCHRLNFPVADFLSIPLDSQISQSETKELFLQSLSASHRGKSKVMRESRIRQTLEAALLEVPPPSLAEVARRLGYIWTYYLSNKYGDLSQRISDRYQNDVGSQPDEEKDRQMRQLLEQELNKENPRRPSALAAEIGYKYLSTARGKFPELWRSLIAKHRECEEERKRKQLDRERQTLAVALREDPTPTMREILRRLGYSSGERLYKNFPDECRAIGEQRAQQKKDWFEKLEANLRAALSEEPPRTLKDVAASLGFRCGTLSDRWRELCHAIAARYAAYRKEEVLKRRLALKERIRQIVFELHQSGIHPSENHIRPLICDVPGVDIFTLHQILKEIREERGLLTLRTDRDR
jgi:DNA-binding XRE family transcriptional regulator